MTADELKSIIEAGLPCEHIELTGDGRHWYATIVSAEFEGRRAIQRDEGGIVSAGLDERLGELHAGARACAVGIDRVVDDAEALAGDQAEIGGAHRARARVSVVRESL